VFFEKPARLTRAPSSVDSFSPFGKSITEGAGVLRRLRAWFHRLDQRTTTPLTAHPQIALHRVTFRAENGRTHSLVVVLDPTPKVGDTLTVEGTSVVVTAVAEPRIDSTIIDVEAEPN
jgi:hypothetical protein